MSKYKADNFIQVDRSLFKIPKFMALTTQAKWLYICLVELEHKYTPGEKREETFFHSDKSISEMSGIPLRSFKRRKKELIEAGFVLVDKILSPGGQSITRYAIAEKIHFDDYREYLTGDHWKKRAAMKRKSVGNRCEKCGKAGLLHVHHKNYESLHHESMKDLSALCEDCHKALHGI
mgnify:CR=1 FL=1